MSIKIEIVLSAIFLFHRGGTVMQKALVKVLLTILVFFFGIFAEVKGFVHDDEQVHELTLYVIPSTEPLVWDSPSTLFKSYFSSFKKTLFIKEKYLMGHLFVGLTTNLVDQQPFYIGMASASKKEQRNLVLREKIGFAILKADLQGRIESSDDLKNKIGFYLERDELAQITFRVSRKSMERILEFIEIFKAKFNKQHAPCDFYGGTFNPRYRYEGAGCTAFGMAMLELSGIDLEIFEPWLASVNIPMEIIGGKFNGGKEVGIKELKQTKEWHNGEGTDNVDYISHDIYDPSAMFAWIKEQLQLEESEQKNRFIPFEKNGIPGLFRDDREAKYHDNEPLFTSRPNPSIFIDHFFEKIGVTNGLMK